MIDFLLNNAGPSIVLRVKKEILKDISKKEEQELQSQILDEKIIKLITEKQQENGWIGQGFHGSNKNAGQYDNQEVATKYMGEKGLQNTPVLDGAMKAFATTKLTDLCYETKGKVYSEFNVPAYGQNIIRCACIARAHYDDMIDITPQINLALESFRRVTEVDSIFDVSRPTKEFRLFNENERWPCHYHLETLAFTDSWKNKDNISMLSESFKKLMRTDRPEIMNTRVACWVGHPVGPAWYYSEGFSISMDTDAAHIISMDKVEWMARCGLYNHIPKLKEEIEYILNNVDQNGICTLAVNEKEFRGWSPYFGLQLEPDWKSKIRRACDITFRALLILHYAQMQIDEEPNAETIEDIAELEQGGGFLFTGSAAELLAELSKE